MTGTEHDIRADALLAPIDVSIAQARTAALVLGGYAENVAELWEWLEMLGLLPYEADPRSSQPPAGCANTIINYTRPGA
jgi:hypothetical protein